MNNLAKLMKELKEEQVLSQVKKMNEEGILPVDILQELQEGMGLVGQEFERGNYFLSELIMSSTIFQQAMGILKESLTQALEEPEHGTFVIGTVKEDIHDIGKNIAATLLACRGFNVVDLGVDVPIEKFVDAIEEHRPTVVGLSCLLTTSFENMKSTIDAIEKKGLRSGLPIIIGGATIDKKTSDYVGADAFCRNANEGVLIAKKLAGDAS
jgi:methanogenic corrinoid protein MtbC1